MGSRQEQFSGTRDVREAHRIDEARLLEYLADTVEDFQGPLSVAQFKGGQSNPTYKLTATSGSYVLRRKPPGKLLPSAHAVDREFRVISALYGAGFPVPKPHVLCADDDVIGTMFFWEPDLPDCGVAERSEIYEAMNATIAKLHTIDYAALGLEDFGKPGNYFARQISRWSKQYVASETIDVPAMHRLMDWLPGNIPDEGSTSIVHGDYRLDPLADFTYHLMAWQMPDIGIGSSGLAGKDLAALGIPSEAEYVARYCEHTGRSGIENRDFYSAYNFFRIAAILQGIAGRVRDGTAASAHAEAAVKAVTPLADIAWGYAQRAGAAG